MKKILILIAACLVSCNMQNNVVVKNDSADRIDGIDVSRHQGRIDWKKASKDLPDNAFVYIKCTEGATYRDPMYKANADGIRRTTLHRGGYHYFRMTSGAHEQFKNFKRALDYLDGDLVPLVDVETTDGKTNREVRDSLRVFLRLLENEYGKKPMIYGTQRSYNTVCAPAFNNHPLYIGRYGVHAPEIKGKGTYTIWQYSESTTLSGCKKSVDACRFRKGMSVKDIML